MVVNMRAHAREIFDDCRERLPGEAPLVHLSTGMCPAHRTAALDGLRKRLREPGGAPIVCVSTQLIEAGVDIDFAAVVRDLAGLDSLAQAAGRCNRNGQRPAGGWVHIIRLPARPEDWSSLLARLKKAGPCTRQARGFGACGPSITTITAAPGRRPAGGVDCLTSRIRERCDTLAIYTYLTGDARSPKPTDLTEGPGVEYQVRAHFEWNLHQPALATDRNAGKHHETTRRSLERGGRQDIFLGTRDCQGYVAPCVFGEGEGDYDRDGALDYALMLHSFDYPDETGADRLGVNFWRPRLENGVLRFPRPDDLGLVRKDVRAMRPKQFGIGSTVLPVDEETGVLL